ncbi:hypothetical protein PCE1_001312 [Barthelona sp. PCE]
MSTEAAREPLSPVEREPFTPQEIFNMVRNIKDPEHPSATLEDLQIVSPDLIEVQDDKNIVKLTFIPTVPHCTLAMLIALSIQAQLMRCLPPRIFPNVFVKIGTHNQDIHINKQLNDKERVCAALEKPHILEKINSTL